MMNVVVIRELFESKKLADVKIIITDMNSSNETKIELFTHKFVLFTSCPYFSNLINFSGEKIDIINIPIFEPPVLCDIIASFYGVKQNSSDLSECAYLLETIRCYNYLCLDNGTNLKKLCESKILEEDFDLLLEIANIVDGDDLIKLIYDNLPENYDLTGLDKSLINKLSNHTDAKILYLNYRSIIVKKYHPFNLIPKSKIEYTLDISMKTEPYVVLSTDGKKILVSGHNTIVVYDFVTGTNLYTIRENFEKIASISVSPDNTKIITISNYNDIITISNVKIYDLESGILIRKIFSNLFELSCATMSLDGTKIIMLASKIIVVVDYDTENYNASKLSQKINIDRIIKNIIVPKNNTEESFQKIDDIVMNVFVSHNDNIISIGMGNVIKIWKMNGTFVDVLPTENKSTVLVYLSINRNEIILVKKNNCIEIWDIDTRKLIITLTGYNSPIMSIHTTPDSKKIISISNDGTIILWNLNNGEQIGKINSKDMIYADDIIEHLYISPFVNKLSGLEQY